ncbi:expressed unknown protein [Seminavis robusta]|uniref:Uncharacterized protein n=1 Tax=Seminavis robusta TaxID=568900 RepID=A0A9N8EM39_9STRA|nr:expressed unknown protein [Seminavis robusta]|eukprot:Sro1449_g273721.1  (106) ;mRNA; f:26892-27209
MDPQLSREQERGWNRLHVYSTGRHSSAVEVTSVLVRDEYGICDTSEDGIAKLQAVTRLLAARVQPTEKFPVYKYCQNLTSRLPHEAIRLMTMPVLKKTMPWNWSL